MRRVNAIVLKMVRKARWFGKPISRSVAKTQRSVPPDAKYDDPRMKFPRTTQRDFLTKSTLAAAAVGAVPYFRWAQKAFANESASDRLQIGCIGVGSMGTGDARAHAGFGDIVAVCDVDLHHADRAKNDKQIGKGKANAYKDYRRVLERDDIDVVSVVS